MKVLRLISTALATCHSHTSEKASDLSKQRNTRRSFLNYNDLFSNQTYLTFPIFPKYTVYVLSLVNRLFTWGQSLIKRHFSFIPSWWPDIKEFMKRIMKYYRRQWVSPTTTTLNKSVCLTKPRSHNSNLLYYAFLEGRRKGKNIDEMSLFS